MNTTCMYCRVCMRQRDHHGDMRDPLPLPLDGKYHMFYSRIRKQEKSASTLICPSTLKDMHKR